MARRLTAEGLSLRQVARQVSCSHQAVKLVVEGNGDRWARPAWAPATGRLTLAERAELSLGVHRGETFSAIASRVGRVTSTVSREVAANGGRDGYRAWRAHERARERTRRPKLPKLACPRLAAQVTACPTSRVASRYSCQSAATLGCGVQVAATRPSDKGPGKIRNPSPESRPVPHEKQVGNGCETRPGYAAQIGRAHV